MTALAGHTRAVLEAVPGAWGCAVMGLDGLPLSMATEGDRAAELSAFLTEVSAPLAALRRVALNGPEGARGPWADATLGLSRGCHLVVRALGDAHFVALVVGPEALSGRARYVLRLFERELAGALFP